MSKFRDLLQGNIQGSGFFIQPAPDMEITYTAPNGRSVLVEGTKPFPPHSVVEFVQKEKGGRWMFGIMANGKWQKDNPYKNEYGLWTWLLVKEP